MATQQPEHRTVGSEIIVETAFELIGVGLMSLLAGINNEVGTIVVIVMAGFLLGWLLLHANTLAGWMKGL